MPTVSYFSVSIALLEEETPIAGVVYNPITDEMFSASYGKVLGLMTKQLGIPN